MADSCINLTTHIKKFTFLSEADEIALLSYVKPLQIKKKALLLKEGQVCKANYFVEKGCLRLFFVDEKGAEQTSQFAIENWWITDYASFCNRAPSQFYIQAVEHSSIIAIERTVQEALFAQLPQLERYFRQVLENAYAASQQRIRYMFSLSKENMYKHFSASFPGFVQRVPQYMLASYLGLTPEYVSEIRKKKA